MASIIQIGDKHRAQIRRKGQPTMTKTFASLEQAQEWARAQESIAKSSKDKAKAGVTLAQVIKRYQDEEKSAGKTANDVMGYLTRGLGSIQLDKMTDDDIVAYIKGKKFSPASGALHFSFLRSVMKMASVGWGYNVPDILDHTKDRLNILGLIGKSNERKRRLTDLEFKMLTSYEFNCEIPMVDIIKFAISSTMRQSEITRIEHCTINHEDKTIVITDRKHPTKKLGNDQIVPLLDESIEIIKRQSRGDRVFPYCPKEVGRQFSNACKDLGIVDLHFHDLRHEGASRLFEMGYRIEEVQKFTGHEDWKMLQRYTHLESKNIRRLDFPKGDKTELSAVVEMPMMDAELMKQFQEFVKFQNMMKQAA